MVNYNQKKFSARAITDCIYAGQDVIIHEDEWFIVPSANSYCGYFGHDENGDQIRVYPIKKISAIFYSKYSKSALYSLIRNILNEMFSSSPCEEYLELY